MGIPQDARPLKISTAKGEAAGKMTPWLRGTATLSSGPESGPSTSVTSCVSKENLKGGQRQASHWGLLASSSAEKMPASGQGETLP